LLTLLALQAAGEEGCGWIKIGLENNSFKKLRSGPSLGSLSQDLAEAQNQLTEACYMLVRSDSERWSYIVYIPADEDQARRFALSAGAALLKNCLGPHNKTTSEVWLENAEECTQPVKEGPLCSHAEKVRAIAEADYYKLSISPCLAFDVGEAMLDADATASLAVFSAGMVGVLVLAVAGEGHMISCVARGMDLGLVTSEALKEV
jgi:hypothetical protein